MKHLLAIDPGGTKCDAILVAPDGEVLGYVAHQKMGWTARDPTVILEACAKVLRGVKHKGLFVAMTCPLISSEVLTECIGLFAEIKGVCERTAALRLSGEAHGIIVLAGTGAFVSVEDDSGQIYMFDGKGPLVGDSGGGFFIGLQALRAMFRSRMHPRHSSSLEKRVLEALGGDTIERLQFLQINPNDRRTIASLSGIVEREAQSGDRISLEILGRAAKELSETVFDAVDKHGLQDSDYPLIATGSVLCRSDLVWNRFVEHVRKFAPRLRFIRLSQYPAVAGVALEGVYHWLDEKAYREFRQKLLDSITVATNRRET